MPRVTTAELHCEIEQVKKDINVIKDNHLTHLEATCVSLQNDVKDNRKYFDDRLNKLDNKIWTLVLLTLGTLAGTITGIMI